MSYSFAQLYDTEYSSFMHIIFSQLYGFKYSNLILIIICFEVTISGGCPRGVMV